VPPYGHFNVLCIMSRLQRVISTLREALQGEEQEFTSGSIDRAIILLSIPMILEMAMESLFAIVDAFFVAKISTTAVATVGVTESVLTLLYSIAIGLSAAATAMVSRRIGEGDRDAAAKAGAQTIVLALIISVALAIPGYIFAKDILLFMSNDPILAEQGYKFTQLLFAANLPILLLWMLNGIFRGAGDAATAMRALWVANAVNIILCPILIFGWGPIPAYGLLGSAMATTTGRSIGVLYQLWHLFGVGRIVRIKLQQFRPDPIIIQRLLSLAGGSTGQYLIASFSWVVLMAILSQISTQVTAGYTIAIRIVIFTILPAWGMANAAATLVGQNLGAGQPERAEQSAWRAAYFNMLFMGCVTVVYLIFAPAMIGIFTSDPVSLEAGTLALRIMGAGYIFYGYSMVLSQSLNGAGDTITPTLMNFVCFWIVEMPLAWTLAHWVGWGQTGVYLSIVLSETLLGIVSIWVFRRGRWKTAVV
jgi:putative MATE family efflux protein